jgi:hypothetical protein
LKANDRHARGTTFVSNKELIAIRFSVSQYSVALLNKETEVRQVLDPVFKEPLPVSGFTLWVRHERLSSAALRPAPSNRGAQPYGIK